MQAVRGKSAPATGCEMAEVFRGRGTLAPDNGKSRDQSPPLRIFLTIFVVLLPSRVGKIATRPP